MPMSRFPHSGSVILIKDPNHENFNQEARVHYVLAHNGCQDDPVLTAKLLETGIVPRNLRVSQVEVVRDGLQVSFLGSGFAD